MILNHTKILETALETGESLKMSAADSVANGRNDETGSPPDVR